jgi:integrase
MTSIMLKFVTADVDANGNIRYYFRRPRQRKIRLRGLPGSREFMNGYQAALSGNIEPLAQSKQSPPPRGSFRALCIAYYGSPKFMRLDDSTKSWQRRSLDAIATTHGNKPVAQLEARHIRNWRNEKSGTPAAANTMLKALRALFAWGEEHEEVDHSPVRGVKNVEHRSAGFHTWTSDEVTQFEIRHPIGTKPRLAMALLLYTAGRREDAVRLGPHHIRGSRLQFVQAKNEHRSPVTVDIPVHPDLAQVIAATPLTGHSTFLVTEYGKPFSPAGFGNRFREWCNQAGLPHCSAHGLRKAAATRLAECGASPHEIMAITGHRTLEEVERYTRAAQKSGLADTAMAKLIGGKT